MTLHSILMIDDDPGISYLAKMGVTRSKDWTVSTATSGQEGLAIAQTEQPDAILLDMMMPGMDGLATLKQLQEHPKTQHIPVIFLTAKPQTSDQLQLGEKGAAGLISKPFDPNVLADQIEKILAKFSAKPN